MSTIGVPDNHFYSAAKGCYSKNIVKAQPLKALKRTSNGAMGIVET